MSYYVLRYKGEGPKPDDQVAKLRLLPSTKIVDNTSPRMTLIESSTALDDLIAQVKSMGLERWVVRADSSFELPDTNLQLKKQL
jgi:hypothetical protein